MLEKAKFFFDFVKRNYEGFLLVSLARFILSVYLVMVSHLLISLLSKTSSGVISEDVESGINRMVPKAGFSQEC